MQHSPFYFGVVEDAKNDELQLGRCRVRVVGIHTENKRDLPTDMLPWAIPLQPITSAGISGIGCSPTGIVEGSWVMITFIDTAFQQPVMMGTIGGYNEDVPFDFDNQDTINEQPKFDQTLSDKPAELGDDKASAGGMAQCVPLSALTSQLPEIEVSAKEIITAFEGVKDGISSSLDSALSELASAKDSLLSSFADAKASASALASSVTDTVSGAAASVAGAASNLVSSSGVGSVASSIESTVQQQLAAASTSLNSTITGISGSLSTTASSLATDIVASAKTAVDSFTSKAFGLVSGIEKSISDMVSQVGSQFAELQALSDSINVEKIMGELKDVVNQAGDKTLAGIDNAPALISAGLLNLDDLPTEAERNEVLSKLQNALADLPPEAQTEALSSSDDIMKQYTVIKEMGSNGGGMRADTATETKMVISTSNVQPPVIPKPEVVPAINSVAPPSEITYMGLTYDVSGSGRVYVSGPGINRMSLASSASTISPESFYALASSPNVTQEGVSLLNKAASKSSDIKTKLGG